MNAAVLGFVLVALAVGAAHRLAVRQPRCGGRQADRRKPAAPAGRGRQGTRRQPRRGQRARGAQGGAGRARESVRAADRGAEGRQGKPLRPVPRDRQQAAWRCAQDLPRAGRGEVHADRDARSRRCSRAIRRSCRRSRRSGSTIMPACARRSSWSGRGRGRSATRPAISSMRCASRPRRAAAGASRASERARPGRPGRRHRLPDGSFGRRPTTAACAPT